MIAEGNETPGGESGGGADRTEFGQRGRRGEGDLLAERRARRAAESGEHALTLRAEAAEATVRTLETHVTSLQQRLRDAEEQGRRMSELIDAAQARDVGERSQSAQRARSAELESALERELQRASQREYAEQRLRMEAQDRCAELEREGRAERDRLSRRLEASENDAQQLAARLASAQRELADAEQAAAAERVAVLRAQRMLQTRLGELEQRAIEIDRGLDAERSERRRAEQLLEEMRRAHRGAQLLVGELAGALARLKQGAAADARARPAAGDALAPRAAKGPIALAEHSPTLPAELPFAPRGTPPSTRGGPAGQGEIAPATRGESEPAARSGTAPQQRSGEMADALAAAVERLRARVDEQAEASPTHVAAHAPHKHSMSLITRWRIALRERRERRKQRR